MNLNREEKTALLMAQDIISLKEGFLVENYRFICSILDGDGWTQYSRLSIQQINYEFKDRKDDFDSDVFSLAEKILGKKIGG